MGDMKEGRASANRSAPRAGARPPKIRVADFFRHVFRMSHRDASAPVNVAPERATDAPRPQLDTPRCPSTHAILEGVQAWPYPIL